MHNKYPNFSLIVLLKSLYFEKDSGIQAFLLPTESSFNCNFSVACDQFTVKNHTKIIGSTKL